MGTFNVGCDMTCTCNPNGKVDCLPRCIPPFHRSGAFSNDPLCVEQFVDEDDCCVVITCASNADLSPESPCTSIQVKIMAELIH